MYNIFPIGVFLLAIPIRKKIGHFSMEKTIFLSFAET